MNKMTVAELITHMKAVAQQYEMDAQALRELDPEHNMLAKFYDGKAAAFFVSASWLEELERS